ncbi:MAG: beta-propeller domain-containing protein [Acidimicrobiia bacterium]|nr:beta-propeller domain-containing protein [Acidimicrobiia bacterium]
MRNRTRIMTAAIVVAVAVTACNDIEPTPTTRGSILPPITQGPTQQAVLASNALVPFDACDAFLDYIIPKALEMVGPYGLEGGPTPWMWRGGMAIDDVAVELAAPAADGEAGGGSSAPNYSTTNLQEVGVDEPDLVKTDGERIVAITEGRLVVVDVTGDEPELLGSLQLEDLYASDMFLSGDRVLLMASNWSSVYPVFEGDVAYNPGYHSPTVQLVELTIADDDPEIVRRMVVDGQYISARMVDGVVRLVLTSGPVGFAWEFPQGSGLKAEREATEANQELIRNSTAENWIPYVLVTDADGDVVAEGTLFDCERANHPKEYSGLNMLSVATIDLKDGLEVVDATGVLATGDTVYASTENLYVATQQWQFWGPMQAGEEDELPDGVTTEIHQFDISNPTRSTYVASGEIDGYLLNQFAMSEHDGLLRTASTTSPTWWGDRGFDSESLITVLQANDGELETIGRVDGLGKTERIFSVRFVEDIAYVVTFRQTDPLYTVDLSDPENPEVVGELKILGYSAYLHPLGNGLILGIGQDATEQGRIQGSQVSIFDVSDPADPVRVAKLTLDEGSSSAVEWDHRAFLYWAETGLAVMPVQQWHWDEGKDEVWFGALAVTIDDDEISDTERVIHPGGESDDGNWDWRAQILRSVVVDDALYTISAKGILKSDLETLEDEGWLRF